MSPKQALEVVQRQGVMLASGKGPVPSLAAIVAGEPIRGSWWSHPRGREIFRALRAVESDANVLVCRIAAGKITFVHRRLWPALVRLSGRFDPASLGWIHQEHTAAGHHENRIDPFPQWVPADIRQRAADLGEDDAAKQLGSWVPD